MNNRLYFLALVLPFLFASCASVGSREDRDLPEVVFEDRKKNASDSEVVIDDRAVKNEQENINVSVETQQGGTTITAADGSQIKTMFDGLGNKTETRTFNENSLLRFVLLSVGADGKREAAVYGQYGEVKKLPDNMLDRVLTASAKELANSAGVFEVFREQNSYAENAQQPKSRLQPLPSSSFVIRNEQKPVEVPELPTENAENNSPTDIAPPADEPQISAVNKKPDED